MAADGAPGPADVELSRRIAAQDVTLFDLVESQTSGWDRRALLALHGAAAARRAPFSYLEIGSYMGGSLQVLMQDPRCVRVVSIDPRPPSPPDKRGTSFYPDNSTERMRSLLAGLPEVDMAKLVTFQCDTSGMGLSDLGPDAPAFCFVDGEHTDAAVLADGRFCAEAVRGRGVVAFHDCELVKPGLMQLITELWPELSAVVGFGGGSVLAIELGGDGVLGDPAIDRAVASRWHSAVWRVTSRPASPRPLLAAWRLMPSLDRAAVRGRGALSRLRARSGVDANEAGSPDHQP